MVQMIFEPVDTLFFRDARSFTAGEDTNADFNFPSPLTFYGAIGTALLDNIPNEDRIKFMRGEYEHPKLGKFDENLADTPLKLKGPFLQKNNDTYFPPPANLWVRGHSNYSTLIPYDNHHLYKWDIQDNNLRPLNINPKETKRKPLEKYISAKDLARYLSGQDIEFLSSEPEDSFFARETRYGHATSKISKIAEDTCLYSATHLRFIDCLVDQVRQLKYMQSGFTVIATGIEESDFPSKTISLGGEKKKVAIKFKNDGLIPEQPEILDKIQKKKKFFIYFATPTIFKNGWRIELPFEFSDAFLVGAAVDKPLYISGWITNEGDFSGKPRPMKKAVRAGSVYFFEAKTWDCKKFKGFYDKYNFGASLSDEYQSAGFGIGLIGCW